MKNNKNDRISKMNQIAKQLGMSSDEMFIHLSTQLANEKSEDTLIWSFCRNLGCNKEELKKLVDEEIEKRASSLIKKEQVVDEKKETTEEREKMTPEELKKFEEFIENYTEGYSTFETNRDLRMACGRRETLSKFGDKEQIKKYYIKYCMMALELKDYIAKGNKSAQDIIKQVYEGKIKDVKKLSDWEEIMEQRKEREKNEKGIGE